MSECCDPGDSDDGVPVGGDADALSFDLTTTDAVPVATQLVSLPVNGAHAMLQMLHITSVNMTAGIEGQGAGMWILPAATLVRNAVDGSVEVAGPRLQLVAPTVLWPTGIPAGGGGQMLGYGPGPVFGAPLFTAALAIAANVLTLTLTGVAATTARWHVRGRVWAFDGAVRLR